MKSEKCLKIAVRKFDAFENVLQTHWNNYKAETGCDWELDAVPMDLTSLYDSLFTHGGMQNGLWDVAQVNTDWIAGARESGALLNLAPFIAAAPPEDYPDGWHGAMLHFQTFGDEVYGVPFHDGPECFIYRKDLFNNEKEQEAYQKRYGGSLRVPQTWDEFVRWQGSFIGLTIICTGRFLPPFLTGITMCSTFPSSFGAVDANWCAATRCC